MEVKHFGSRRGGKKVTGYYTGSIPTMIHARVASIIAIWLIFLRRAPCAKDVSSTLKSKNFPSDRNHEISVAPQSEQSSLCEDCIDNLQLVAALYTTGNIVDQFRAGAGHPEQDVEVSFERLAAQMLREFEVKQANCVVSFDNDNTNIVSSGHLISRKAGILNPHRHQTYVDDVAHFDMSPSSLPIYQEQEEQQNEKFTSMGEIDDFKYQATRLWSTFARQEQVIDMLKDDARDISTQHANLDTTRTLTAWGDDLAGVGEQFSGRKCQEYASAEDFAVEENLVADAQ